MSIISSWMNKKQRINNMKLNSILNKALGLGDTFGPNKLMKDCEKDFVEGGAIVLNKGDEETPKGPDVEMGYSVMYVESSGELFYFPKKVTFKLDNSEMENKEGLEFINPNNDSGMTISDDGKSVTIDVLPMYYSCNGGYMIMSVPLYFRINPQPGGCIGVNANGDSCGEVWVQDGEYYYYEAYVDMFSPRILHITYYGIAC